GFSIQNAHYLARACAAAYLTEPGRLAAAVGELGLAGNLHPFDVVVPEEITDCHGFVAGAGDMALLIFRGSDSLQNWLTDAAIVQRPGPGGLVHKGFGDALDAVWEEVEPVLTEQTRERDLWIAGHGLGGALAVLAAA